VQQTDELVVARVKHTDVQLVRVGVYQIEVQLSMAGVHQTDVQLVPLECCRHICSYSSYGCRYSRLTSS
jgi:hypothetical protein